MAHSGGPRQWLVYQWRGAKNDAVVPAHAGPHTVAVSIEHDGRERNSGVCLWVPAFAGTTKR